MGGKKSYQNTGKTFRKPKRPFEKERLDSEMKIIGEYGLKNKREVWRVQYALSKIRTAARELLTLDEKNETRMFTGEALLRRRLDHEPLDLIHVVLVVARARERRSCHPLHRRRTRREATQRALELGVRHRRRARAAAGRRAAAAAGRRRRR